ncbi:hypothetical protein [Actinacidiphila glaucinigra]|uniref:hypothetical protein n=1 Tax=Actinacidiphila glaucinigra TaxID=235986 RepID=UPI003D946E8D
MIADDGRRAMGATGWDYVTSYRGSVEATLEALHEQVFQELYGDDEQYGDRAALYADESLEDSGTHSILDVRRIVDTPAGPGRGDWDYCTLRPLRPERLLHHFGTAEPTPQQFEDALARAKAPSSPRSRRSHGAEAMTPTDEQELRRTGHYVLLHSNGEPTHVGFFGISGD